jgi:3-dehydroquinate synthase
MKRVRIHVKPTPYDATIQSGLLERAGENLAELMGGSTSRCFTITVPNVRKHWESALTSSLKASAFDHTILEMRDGERYKTMAAVEDLAARLIKLGADRTSILIALGGGVVGDVTGLLAALYMRGLALVQVPTTFLAQVDSSIGGKTGVNLAAGKNLLGTYYHPRAVLIDPAVLTTLGERDFRSGLYEALKCGVIRNAEIFNFMERERERILRRDAGALEWLIAQCVKVKAAVVAEDEREHDLRRVLNFGHTIGHALEAETSYKYFLHGEAVAWGMVAASMIAAGMHRTSSQTAQRIIAAVLAYAPLPKVDIRSKNIVRRLLADKKTTHGVTHFILPREIGQVEVMDDVPERAVLQAVEELRYLSRA